MFSSCREIYSNNQSAPSGYYQIQLLSGSLVEVYCDMEGSNCGGEGGWTRVAYINMTEPNAICPQGLTQEVQSELSLCDNTNTLNCAEIGFTTYSIIYEKVCGQLRGYQYGFPEAFNSYSNAVDTEVDESYLDGVSITYGSSPRTHVWSYVAGRKTYIDDPLACPCNTGYYAEIPPFVGSDYYCESAASYGAAPGEFYAEDPLWDGKQCTDLEGPCCERPNLPWFKKELNVSISEDIDLRLCVHDNNDRTLLQLIELYVF